MQKAGAFIFTFLFAFLPFIIVFTIQTAVSVFTPCVGMLAASLTGTADGETIIQLFQDTDFNVVLMLVYTFLCIPLFGFWYAYRCDGDLRPNPAVRFHPWNFLGILLLIPGAQLFTTLLIALISAVMPQWLMEYEELMETAGMDDTLTLLTVIYAILVGPVCEELIFRGVTLRLFERVCPFWLANLFQAVLFGIFHGNWIQGCYAFALGLLLGFICERGSTIYYSIMAHILFNFMGTYGTLLLQKLSDFVYFDLLFIVSMSLFLGLGFKFYLSGCRKLKARQARLDYLHKNYSFK